MLAVSYTVRIYKLNFRLISTHFSICNYTAVETKRKYMWIKNSEANYLPGSHCYKALPLKG